MSNFFIHPTTHSDVRIAIVGDYPLKDGQSSFSGSFFFNLKSNLKDAGISIDQCLLTSVLQKYPGFRATGKDFNWGDSDVKLGVAELHNTLDEFKPDITIVLGSLTLKHFKPKSDQMDKERGAPFKDASNRLCIASYHPRDLFMFPANTTLAVHDMGKGVRLARENWDYPQFKVNATPSLGDALATMRRLADRKTYIASDIETIIATNKMTCCGLAWKTPTGYESLVIPFKGLKAGTRYWTQTEEKAIWLGLNRVLRECPMVGHNAVHFDHMILGTSHGIQANYVDDTMFAMWECYPEFLKSLAFCNSIFNDDPYWKSDHKQVGAGGFAAELLYCGKDCIATLKCAVALGKEIKDRPAKLRDHYKFNIRISRAYQYMSLTGARVDKTKKNYRILQLQEESKHYQKVIEETCGKGFNVGSSKKMKHLLYDTYKLPVMKKTAKRKDGSTHEVSTADNLTLLHFAREHPEFPILEVLGRQRKLKKRISALVNLKHHPDGRIGWGFNVVGTETGRSSGYKPLDGLGVQPQNVDRRDRDLFLPPEGYHWVKADLEGADSLTVAACLESMGDPRLHDDLKAGLKPAQTLAIAMALKDNGVMSWPVEKIIASIPVLKKSENKNFYKIAKAINHGSAYMLSPKGMHTTIFNQSDGDLFIPPADCVQMQNLLFDRYAYPMYHEQMLTLMNSGALLRTEYGQERYFFGRKDNATRRKMLAYLPQAHTAYVTNSAIERLYYGDANRNPDGRLFMPLCNQVHDETDFYLPIGQEDRGAEVFDSVKRTPLSIWGVDFEIEFEAEYGSHWGNLTNPLV